MITTFLNVDLDLEGVRGLATLLKALDGAVLVVRQTKTSVSFELPHAPKTAADAIAELCDLIDALPPKASAVWGASKRRTFNVGIQAGGRPHSWEMALGAAELARVSQLNSSVVFTVYGASER